MRTRWAVMTTLAISLVAVGTSTGARGATLSAGLFNYPGWKAQWVKGAGVPDGGPAHGLVLRRLEPNAHPNGAGAVVFGVEGMVVSELGFDVDTAGECTGTTPRIRLRGTDLTGAAVERVYTCDHRLPLRTEPAAGWARFRFPVDNVTASSVVVIFDGQTRTTVDNIDVNGQLIGRSGKA